MVLCALVQLVLTSMCLGVFGSMRLGTVWLASGVKSIEFLEGFKTEEDMTDTDTIILIKVCSMRN